VTIKNKNWLLKHSMNQNIRTRLQTLDADAMKRSQSTASPLSAGVVDSTCIGVTEGAVAGTGKEMTAFGAGAGGVTCIGTAAAAVAGLAPCFLC
jgi:hypothetical protein